MSESESTQELDAGSMENDAERTVGCGTPLTTYSTRFQRNDQLAESSELEITQNSHGKDALGLSSLRGRCRLSLLKPCELAS